MVSHHQLLAGGSVAEYKHRYFWTNYMIGYYKVCWLYFMYECVLYTYMYSKKSGAASSMFSCIDTWYL